MTRAKWEPLDTNMKGIDITSTDPTKLCLTNTNQQTFTKKNHIHNININSIKYKNLQKTKKSDIFFVLTIIDYVFHQNNLPKIKLTNIFSFYCQG